MARLMPPAKALNPVHMRRHIKESFASTYLTIISIIQGVALSALYSVVEPRYEHFGIAQWIMVAATLLLIIATWHLFMINALAFKWVLSLMDSLVPFLLGTLELFVIECITLDQQTWLLALLVYYGATIPAYLNLRIRAVHDPDNQAVIGVIKKSWRWFHRWIYVTVVAQLSLWFASLTELEPAVLRIVLPGLSLVNLVLVLIQSLFYWSAIQRVP